MYWSPRFCASLSVTFSRRPRSFEACTSPCVPSTLGNAVELLQQLRAQQVDVDAGLVEQRAHGAALLVEQRQHQVQRAR